MERRFGLWVIFGRILNQPQEHRLATLWEDALGATLDACCAGWAEQL
jgi:hypothetical protein